MIQIIHPIQNLNLVNYIQRNMIMMEIQNII